MAITVMDEEEFVPVAKAQVRVSEAGTRYTNFYGRTVFQSLKNGPYFVSVKHPAYKTHEKIYFAVDKWKELQIYLQRSMGQDSPTDRISRIPASKKDLRTASYLRKFGFSLPVSIVPDMKYINKLIVHLSQDPRTQMFLETDYYTTARKPRSTDLGDSINLINKLNKYDTPHSGKAEDNIEYILGQPISPKDVNMNKLLFKKKKKRKPHRNVGILTVVAGDEQNKPVKGIPVSVYSMKSGKLLGEKNTDSFGRVIFYEIPKIRVKVTADDQTKIIPIRKTYTLCDFKISKTPGKQVPIKGLDAIQKFIKKKTPVTESQNKMTSESIQIMNIQTPETEAMEKAPEKSVTSTTEAKKGKSSDKSENEWVEINTVKKGATLTSETEPKVIKIDKKKKFKW